MSLNEAEAVRPPERVGEPQPEPAETFPSGL
jgi:hypothetical protein